MDLLVCFIKQSVLSSETDIFSASNKKFLKRACQKDDSNLVIGAKTKICLKEAKLNDTDRSKFYKHVQKFYKKAC